MLVLTANGRKSAKARLDSEGHFARRFARGRLQCVGWYDDGASDLCLCLQFIDMQ